MLVNTVVAIFFLLYGSFAVGSSLFPFLDGSRSDVDLKDICGGSFGNKCGDCFTMMICLGSIMDPIMTECPDDKPYCDRSKNYCTSDVPADVDCLQPPQVFKCPTQEGFFPHPTNCSQYYECHKGEAHNLQCPPKYSWTTDGMGCRQNKKSSDCGTIKCKKNDISAALSNNATFYGMCGVPGNIDSVKVLKCEGRNMLYDVELGCTFTCPDEGLYADESDPTFYYECYRSNTFNNYSQLLYERKQCTADREFDENVPSCVEV